MAQRHTCARTRRQAAIDLALALLALRSLPPPDTDRSAFQELATAGVLSSDLADRLAGWAGLRNVLTHMYTEVDPGRLLLTIRNDLPDLDEFVRIVAAELAAEGGNGGGNGGEAAQE